MPEERHWKIAARAEGWAGQGRRWPEAAEVCLRNSNFRRRHRNRERAGGPGGCWNLGRNRGRNPGTPRKASPDVRLDGARAAGRLGRRTLIHLRRRTEGSLPFRCRTSEPRRSPPSSELLLSRRCRCLRRNRRFSGLAYRPIRAQPTKTLENLIASRISSMSPSH